MIYRGIVENNIENIEPKLMAGRVQVRVFGIHSQNKALIPTEALPWAEVQGSTSFGLIRGVGVSSILQIDTWVYVQFEGGDIDRPIVTGTVIGVTDGESDINKVVQENYANVQYLETPSGHTVEFSDVGGDEKIIITHKTGTKVNFDKDGKFNIVAVNDMNVNVDGDANIETTGDTNLKCVNIDVNASGDASLECVNAKIKANKVDIDSSKISLGIGGPAIARLGDAVQGGTSDGASFSGTIVSGSSNHTST